MVFQAVLGILSFVGIAWAISENRKQVHAKTVLVGILIQLIKLLSISL